MALSWRRRNVSQVTRPPGLTLFRYFSGVTSSQHHQRQTNQDKAHRMNKIPDPRNKNGGLHKRNTSNNGHATSSDSQDSSYSFRVIPLSDVLLESKRYDRWERGILPFGRRSLYHVSGATTLSGACHAGIVWQP